METLLDLQLKSQELRQLSPVEKAKLEHQLAIDQLYYSSKIEGSSLSTKMIERAIHGRKLPAS